MLARVISARVWWFCGQPEEIVGIGAGVKVSITALSGLEGELQCFAENTVATTRLTVSIEVMT
jgi:hypothetical protein